MTAKPLAELLRFRPADLAVEIKQREALIAMAVAAEAEIDCRFGRKRCEDEGCASRLDAALAAVRAAAGGKS